MAVSCRGLVAFCIFTALLSLVRCADESHSERPQKEEHQPSSGGVGKTGTEDLQKHQGPGSKRASSGLQGEDLDCDCRKGQHGDSSQKKGRDGKRGGKRSDRDAPGLTHRNHTFDDEAVEGRNATWQREQEDRNASRIGNETHIRGRGSFMQQEGKGKCDCTHGRMSMARAAESRTGKGGCKGDDDSQRSGKGKGKGGRFLQGKRSGGGCDENDGMSLPVALGAAGAGLGALCIAVGLLCVCCRRRASVAPNEKLPANTVVICDIEKPTTCEGVLPTSQGVVVGNPASTA